MYIQIDKNKNVTGYSPTEMSDAVEYDGELPEDFQENCRMYRLVNGKLIFDEDKQSAAEQRESLQNELNEIHEWFTWYDNQVAQYLRCVRIGEEFNKDIHALDEEANLKQSRIREIQAASHG